MNKIYYQLQLTQVSPLRLSNGENQDTDSDLMRDSQGKPYIPGSSLAGAMRSHLDTADAEALFGEIHDDGKNRESRILVSDAVLTNDAAYHISSRDSVRLDENGVAEDTGKFDFEVVECTQPYTAILEVNDLDETSFDAQGTTEKLLSRIIGENGISLGGRTTRGYGHMKVTIKRICFTFPNDMTKWLDFDPLSGKAWDSLKELKLTVQPDAIYTTV